MKKIIRIISLAALMLGAATVNANAQGWFAGAGAGVNLSLDGPSSSPALGAGVGLNAYGGYAFDDIIAVRASVNGLTNYHKADGSFSFADAGADLLLNFSEGFGGYNPERKYSLIPYLHLGAWFPEDRNIVFAPGAGILNSYRIIDALDLTLDLRGLILSQSALQKGNPKGVVAAGSILVGVAYKFGK